MVRAAFPGMKSVGVNRLDAAFVVVLITHYQ